MTSKFSHFATKRQPIIGALCGLFTRNGKKSNVYTCSSLFIRIFQICNRSSPSIHIWHICGYGSKVTKAGILSKMFFGVHIAAPTYNRQVEPIEKQTETAVACWIRSYSVYGMRILRWLKGDPPWLRRKQLSDQKSIWDEDTTQLISGLYCTWNPKQPV